MIKKLVGVQPQATPFFATVQLMAEDIRAKLDEIWEQEKAQFSGQTVKQDGFRPRQVTQADVEAQDLTRLYFEFWLGQLLEGLQSKTGRRVAYVTDLNAQKQGNMFVTNAIVYPQPEVSWKPDRAAFMSALAEIFLADKPVEDRHVEEEITNRRLQLRFNKNRLKIDREYTVPIKEGDTVYCEVTNEFAKSQNKPPEQHIIKMGPECPSYLRQAISDAKVGDTVLAGKDVDPEGQQKVTMIVKIIGLVDAPEVSDEELLKVQDHATMDIFKMNVKREIERNLTTNFDEMFSQFLRTRTTLSPIPGPMVFDRAEGTVNHIIQSKTQAELRRAGFTDASAAINGMLPRMNDEIHRECVCSEIAKDLGLTVTPEDLADFAEKNKAPVTPEVQYVAEMDVILRKVYTYYRSKGQDRGDVKRIELASSLANLPKPPGDQPQRSNLIHLK